ncbi:zinc uptake protein ZrgA [Vibrio kanaloae]|uniref:zinc uptake protein ZrgA n=1 Tax=Vibrio kanaloae TaxID=170673 RepID=UPI0010BDFE33|nr:DUF2796 domain-containing protein [Vibrio kanaloae]TKF05292.1 DUF2796 domain-containing protein [Vibrio kanaloae]TKF66157.1 DUF2796 domain-containing protein [Vibrio kanaloae]
MKPSILAVVIGMTVSTNVLANEEFRSHEAHVHGQVEVNIAQDGQELLVEVTAPGADVVGFEHAPETTEQKKVFEQAIAQLNKPDELFSFNNASCTLKFKSVTNTLEHDHDDHEGHDHAEHEHDDHEGHDHSEGGHGEFTVEYHYQCSDIEKLDTVNTQWFSKFSNTKSMTVNLLTDSAQIQEVLNADRISFRF